MAQASEDPQDDASQWDDNTARPRRRRSQAAEDVSSPGNPVIALGAAAAVAVVGLIAWTALAYYANVELGWLAWGIGAGIGAACAALGGRGMGTAVICGVLAVFSIAGGWYFTAYFAVGDFVEQQCTEEMYTQLSENASAVAELPNDPSDEALRKFMEEKGIAEDPAIDIPAGEVAEFRDEVAYLKEFPKVAPTLEAWRADAQSKVPLFDVIKENINAISLLFLVLGIASAFGLVSRATEGDEAQQRAADRAERADRAAQRKASGDENDSESDD